MGINYHLMKNTSDQFPYLLAQPTKNSKNGTFAVLLCYRNKKLLTMKDPKEQDEQTQSGTDSTADQQSTDKRENNWDKNQQVDEEGNQVDPEDIK